MSTRTNLAEQTLKSAVDDAQTNAVPAAAPNLGPVSSLRLHWPEYLMEGGLLGAFMVAACGFGALYEFPDSPVHHAVMSGLLLRLLMGFSLGATVVAIVYSPWGRQSGAHINPSVTLTFFRLGKIKFWDALFYVASQFTGAVTAVALVAAFFSHRVAGPALNYVVTFPDPQGPWKALAVEFAIAFCMMSLVLYFSNHHRFAKYTGLFVGLLVAAYITFEAPFSGMSMSVSVSMGPESTSGLGASTEVWKAVLIYLTVPPLGMLAAAEIYLWRKGQIAVKCCKLHHDAEKRCIFCGANGGFAS